MNIFFPTSDDLFSAALFCFTSINKFVLGVIGMFINSFVPKECATLKFSFQVIQIFVKFVVPDPYI